MSVFRCALFMVIALSLTVVSATAAEFKRIKKASEFARIVVDKKVTGDWGWTTAFSDGTIIGQVNSQAAQGKWKWQGGYYCRTISFGNTSLPRNCMSVHVSGDTAVFIRDKGKGVQIRVKIE